MTQNSKRSRGTSCEEFDIASHHPWIQLQTWIANNKNDIVISKLSDITTGPLEKHKVEYCCGVVTRVIMEESGNKLIELSDGTETIQATVYNGLLNDLPQIGNKGSALGLYCASILEYEPLSRSLIVVPENIFHYVVSEESVTFVKRPKSENEQNDTLMSVTPQCLAEQTPEISLNQLSNPAEIVIKIEKGLNQDNPPAEAEDDLCTGLDF